MTAKRLPARSLILTLLLTGTASAADPPPAGAILRDCPHCPELVVIARDGAMIDGTGPGGGRPFAIGRYEVTFAEWEACRRAGGCAADPDDHGWGRGDRPVINVSYADAVGYTAWLARETGRPYRLPTEREWEQADRAGRATRFWWGDDVGKGRANCRNCGSPWDGRSTAPVGSFAPNPLGLYDTVGNVWEWVATCWQAPSSQAAALTAARQAEERGVVCAERVIRGGAWYYRSKSTNVAWRARSLANAPSYTIGFRVLREITEPPGDETPGP